MKDYLHYLTANHEFRVASPGDKLPHGSKVMTKFSPGQMVGPPEAITDAGGILRVIAICDPHGTDTKWGIPVIYQSAPHIK